MHIADNDEWAALHYSAKNGTYELFTYLADLEVDTCLKTNDGSNCLHIFAVNGYLDLCKTLIDKYRFERMQLIMTDGQPFIILLEMVVIN